ncbi:MAG: hypothetical protein JWQ24_1295 [Tardiphaga sp.]|nr:hypothetical protein [Tardiphaga sp.]
MLDAPTYEFKLGDRLQLSKVGRQRNPRIRAQFCTVVKVGGERMISNNVVVRFDGNVCATRLHRSYLEPLSVR